MAAPPGAPLLESLWLQMSLLLTVAMAGQLLMRRLGQPLVVGEILLGILLGPSILGLLTGTAVVGSFAQLGAVILLFVVGLECNLKEIYTRKSIAIAAGGVILPWLGGYAMAAAWGFPGAQAIFMGAIFTATSVGITAAVLLELGVLGSPAAKAILGAAVVDDVLGMLALAIASGLAGGTFSVERLLLLLLAAVLFLVLGAFLGRRYATRLVLAAQRWGEGRGLPHYGFLLAMGIAFLYAFAGETIGVSAIVGAFVAGTIFSSFPLKGEFERGTSYLHLLFAPIFFMSIGILVDLKGALGLAAFGLLLSVAAIATKLIGCWLPARLSGYTGRQSLFIGVGMVPRGEVGLVIAVFGLTAGIIDGALYSTAVLAVFLTTVVAPPVLRALAKRPLEGPPGAPA